MYHEHALGTIRQRYLKFACKVSYRKLQAIVLGGNPIRAGDT